MGHTLVADVENRCLIIFGGYALYYGILGDLWRYYTHANNYLQETTWSTVPSPRYFHASAIYKVYVSVFAKTEMRTLIFAALLLVLRLG